MRNTWISSSLNAFMAIAFFWMVLGELITLHQKRIYHIDLLGDNHPFIKPKTDDEDTVFLLQPSRTNDTESFTPDLLFVQPLMDDIALHTYLLVFCSTYRNTCLSDRLLICSAGMRSPPAFS